MELKKRSAMLLLVGVALASFLTASACLPERAAAAPKPTPAAGTPAAKPQYGGVLKIIESLMSIKAFGYPPQMGPIDWYCALPAVEGLVLYPEKGTIPQPLLATAWKYSPDRKSLTFTLRKGIKFHDGTDFNAEAVKFNLNANKTSRTELASITSIDVIDDRCLRR